MANVGRILKTSHPDLYNLNIQNQFVQGYGDPTPQYGMLYKTINTKLQDERFSNITGLGLYSKQGFGSNPTFDSIYQGYDCTITPAMYSKGYTVEKTTLADDPTGLISGGPLARSHAAMAKETLEVLGVSILNTAALGVSSDWGAYPNGETLLDDTHAKPSGGTLDNLSSSTLSIAALQAGYIAMAKTQSARGNINPVTPSMVVVPPDSKFLLDQLLDSTGMPYSADNTVNSVKGLFKKVVLSRLTNSTAWFMMADPASEIGGKGSGLVCILRQNPEFRTGNVLLSGDRQHIGDFRVGFGWYDWRGIYGYSTT